MNLSKTYITIIRIDTPSSRIWVLIYRGVFVLILEERRKAVRCRALRIEAMSQPFAPCHEGPVHFGFVCHRNRFERYTLPNMLFAFGYPVRLERMRPQDAARHGFHTACMCGGRQALRSCIVPRVLCAGLCLHLFVYLRRSRAIYLALVRRRDACINGVRAVRASCGGARIPRQPAPRPNESDAIQPARRRTSAGRAGLFRLGAPRTPVFNRPVQPSTATAYSRRLRAAQTGKGAPP